jgi:hypothetical protein
MTTIPDPDDPDTEGTTVPPYDDRKETAESGEGTASDDPTTAGAAAPASSHDELSEPEPDETEGGATASPADEQPAQEESDDPGEGTGETGPSHAGGTGRAEDQP